MGDKSFKKRIQLSHSKLMKWAEKNNVRFVTRQEKEREERRDRRR